jgi:predicted nucleic acid-binding protein
LSGWLLDTNVLSELRRPTPDAKVIGFITALSLDTLFVSIVTLAEIRYGIELIAESRKRAVLTKWLTESVRPMFGGRVLPISEDVMVRWRTLVENGRKAGHTYSQPDLIIAATGLHYGLTVVTRNSSDYLRTSVSIINPWLDRPSEG